MIEELLASRSFRVFGPRKLHSRGQHMAWLESEVNTLHMDEAGERQTRRRRDNRGDCDLRHDQRPSETLRQTAPSRTLDAARNDFDNVGSGSLPAWEDAKEYSREGCHPE